MSNYCIFEQSAFSKNLFSKKKSNKKISGSYQMSCDGRNPVSVLHQARKILLPFRDGSAKFLFSGLDKCFRRGLILKLARKLNPETINPNYLKSISERLRCQPRQGETPAARKSATQGGGNFSITQDLKT